MSFHPTETAEGFWPGDLDARRMLSWYIASAGRPVTIAELVNWLDIVGFAVPGRPSKVVSDTLRADVARGRLRRVGRGCYVMGTIAPATLHRMKHSARNASALAAQARLRAATADLERRRATG